MNRRYILLPLLTRLTWAIACIPLQAAAQDARHIHEPSMPPVCSSLQAKLNAPDVAAELDDTARLQQAIDHCAAGQAVELAASDKHDFFSRPLILRAGIGLIINDGVTLFASTDPAAYDKGNHTCGSNDDSGKGCTPFLTVQGGSGGGIYGRGTIDGQGGHAMTGQSESWWQLSRRAQREHKAQNVPHLIVLEHARAFSMYRITLRNSLKFHVVLNQVDGFIAWDVKIDTPADARNTDGIDPVSSRNVTIAYSSIRAGDDNVAIKSGSAGPSENISILHNHFYSGHGMSIGSNTDGGIHHVLVEDLSMDGTTSGLRIKSDVSRGGLVEGIRYRDVCLRDVKTPIDFDSAYDKNATGDKFPIYRDIHLQDVHSITPGHIVLNGLDDAHLLKVDFDNVVIAGKADRKVSYANVNVLPSTRQPINCERRFVPFPSQVTP
jgi:polygalacturonase